MFWQINKILIFNLFFNVANFFYLLYSLTPTIMKFCALDIEAVNLKPYQGTVWMVSVNRSKKLELYEDCNGKVKLPADLIRDLSSPSVCKIIHNALYDIPYLFLSKIINCKVVNIWDTKLTEEVIIGQVLARSNKVNKTPAELKMEELYSSSLENVLPRYGFPKPNKGVRNSFINRPKGIPFTKEEKNYSLDDVKYLPAIQKAQQFILTRDKELEVAMLENKVVERYIEMKIRGIGFDSNIWRRIAEDNIKEFNLRMSKLPNSVSNWNSEKQVKQYFRSRGILIPSYSELDTIYLQTRNKELGQFIYARELHKSVTSYGLNWFDEGFIDADGRIRCDVRQIINTGRNAMSNPNLQQLPGKGSSDFEHQLVIKEISNSLNYKMQPMHRSAFVPSKGHVFVIGDFTGQEIGVMAAAAEETTWINAMLRGEDVHSLTASMLYSDLWAKGKEKQCAFPKKCSCKIHSDLRTSTKILNFMLAYGGGSKRFADSTGLKEMEARLIIKKYRRVIPKLTRWLERNAKEAVNTGKSYSADPYRRRRLLKGAEEWKIANQGKNNPIQAAGANMLKLTMISLPEDLYIALVIHDEIILEVPKAKANKAAKILKSVMEQSADYITGIKGLIRVTPRIATDLMKTD